MLFYTTSLSVHCNIACQALCESIQMLQNKVCGNVAKTHILSNKCTMMYATVDTLWNIMESVPHLF